MDSKDHLKMEATSLNFAQVIDLLAISKVEQFNSDSTKVTIDFGKNGYWFTVRQTSDVEDFSCPAYTFTKESVADALYDGNRLSIADAQGFTCNFDLDEAREVMYLSNASGEAAGGGTNLDVTDADLRKIPFESGPGVVLVYLTEIDGRKYVQGDLELRFRDGCSARDAHLYDSEEAVRAYCRAVRNFIRPRLAGGALLLSLDEDELGLLIVQVAVPLESVVDREDALRRLGTIFGTTANQAAITDFGDLPDHQNPVELSEDDESYGPQEEAAAIMSGYVSTHHEFEKELADPEAWRRAASIELSSRNLPVVKTMTPETLAAIVNGDLDMPAIYASARASKAST